MCQESTLESGGRGDRHKAGAAVPAATSPRFDALNQILKLPDPGHGTSSGAYALRSEGMKRSRVDRRDPKQWNAA